MENGCKGCRSFNRKRELCSSGINPQMLEIKQCPCSICLVKTMCSRGCQDFQDYKTYIKHKQRYKGIKRC